MPLLLKGTVKPGAADRRYYMIRVQAAGRRVNLSSGTRKRDLAEHKEQMVLDALMANPQVTQQELVELVRGEGASTPASRASAPKGALTLKGAFDRCLRSPTAWRGLKSNHAYAILCRKIQAVMGANTPLASITRRDIEGFITHMLDQEKAAPATVNRHLACLRRMFNIALLDEWDDAPDHFPKVRQLKERGARQYFMSSEDESAIFTQVLALDTVRPGPEGGIPRKRDAHRYYVLFTFLVETGLRLGEALGLQWVEVSTPTGGDAILKLFRPEALKTGKPRSVPLTQKAQEALQACKGVKGGPFTDLNARRAQDIWTRAKEAAGVTHRDCVIHSLRHTCASRLLESGVDLKIVKEWLGHSVITTTDGYTHLATHQLTAAAAGLEKLRSRGT